MDSHIKFAVEESVWFKRGEEIDDILSVSLEPEIKVEDNGDYVVIKGDLRLNGEYRMLEEASEGEQEENEQEHLSFRTVQDIRVHEDGIADFIHQFPVEITIPIERVAQVDDIFISVHSFDYTLPNERCFKMSAELEITGIKNEKTSEAKKSLNRVKDVAELSEEILSDEKTTFEIDIKKKVEEEADPAREKVENEITELNKEEKEQEAVVQMPQIELKGREENKNEQEETESDTSEQISAKVEGEKRNKDEKNEETELNQEELQANEKQEEAEAEEKVREEENEEEKKKTEKGERNENALYLTKMLTRDGEEFSKLRMRIIQPGDSLTSIAEAYELQPSQLARVNRLEDEEIEEGQILYIPVKNTN